jgi:oligopeptide transport system permease protein
VAARGGLARFVLRRLVWLVPIVLSAVVITFLLAHLAPGTPWDVAVGGEVRGNLSATAIHNLNVKYGLDRPLWRQLVLFLDHASHLDFGASYQFQAQPARALLLQGLPQTVALGCSAFVVAAVAGISSGLIAARRRSTWVDYSITGLSSLAASVPNFVVGILLILVFSVGLHRSTGGRFYLPTAGFGFDRRLLMPVVTLSLLPLAHIARLMRASALEVVDLDYVRTARAKGATERAIFFRHIMRTALVPVITTLGPLLAFLITGSLVVETLFQIPGIGATFVHAVSARDYPVILGGTVLYATAFPVMNLVVDVVHAVVDPRILEAP